MNRPANSTCDRIWILLLIVLITLLSPGCNPGSGNGVRVGDVFARKHGDGNLTMWFFYLEYNDRSGDAILIELPTGDTMLVDSGIYETSAQLNGYLKQLGISHLDYAIATHAHHDHIGGYRALLRTLTVDRFLTVNVPHATGTYEEVMQLIAEHGIPITRLEAGDTLALPGGVDMLVLNPPEGTTGADVPEGSGAAGLNNLSLVFRLDYGENSFLFTADIYRARERALLATYRNELKADVLKVPHHGESTSSSSAFIDAVDPDYAVITINILQSLPIYKRYRSREIKTFLTGVDGTVKLCSDGENISFITEHERETDLLP